MRRLLIADGEVEHFEDLLKNIEELEEIGDNSMKVYRTFSSVAILLDEGEVVARWGDCPDCGETLTGGPRIGRTSCPTCYGTGRVLVQVEEGK